VLLAAKAHLDHLARFGAVAEAGRVRHADALVLHDRSTTSSGSGTTARSASRLVLWVMIRYARWKSIGPRGNAGLVSGIA